MSDAFVIAPPPEEEPEFVEIEASEGGESVLMITTKETKEVAKKLEVVQLEKYELQSKHNFENKKYFLFKEVIQWTTLIHALSLIHI